jgi:hypothetical protein
MQCIPHNDHLDEPTRRAPSAKIGLEAMQEQYWFQNQRFQMQVTVTHILFSFHACMINCTASGAKSQRIDCYSFFFKFLQAKTMVQNSKVAQRENAALMAENGQAILKKSCFTCGGATVPTVLPTGDRRLLMETFSSGVSTFTPPPCSTRSCSRCPQPSAHRSSPASARGPAGPTAPVVSAGTSIS